MFACIDPTTGSIVRGKTPWYIWPAAHPTHLQIPCVCLVALELLVEKHLRIESGRFVAGPGEPADPILSTYRRVICEEDGLLKKQLKAACWHKLGCLPHDERPRFYRRSNPWWLLRHRLVAAGRLAYVDAERGRLRGPRVQVLDTAHRTDLLQTLGASASAGASATPRGVALMAALRASHLERVVDGGWDVWVDGDLGESELPAGGVEVLGFMRKASERMTTS